MSKYHAVRTDVSLHLSADSPRVLEAALKEIERSNGRIRSPLCFLRSRLTSVRTA